MAGSTGGHRTTQEHLGNASGIFNLIRNVGGSVGISTVTTLLARRSQVHQIMMVGNMSPSRLVYTGRLKTVVHYMAIHAAGASSDAIKRSLYVLYGALLKQSVVWAFVDIFEWKMLLCAICILLVLVLKNVKSASRTHAH